MPTNSFQSTLAAVSSFSSDAATLVCSNCFKLLAFPSTAQGVKCPSCESVTTHVKAKCKGCGTKCKIKLGDKTEHKCVECKLVFSGINKMVVDISEDSVAKRSAMIFIDVETSLPSGTKATKRLDAVAVLNQPLRSSIEIWEAKHRLGLPQMLFIRDGEMLDIGRTPNAYDLKSFDVLVAKPKGSGENIGSTDTDVVNAKGSNLHDFVTAQFGTPTNCAFCKEFIWGVFKQGKKCSKCHMPIHHRCAHKVTMMCDSHLKDIMGVVDFSADPSMEGGDAKPEVSPQWVSGVVIPEEHKDSFITLLDEAVEPDCDPNVMSSLNTLTNFTDDQIKQMWVQYDEDESGVLERDEMFALMQDLLQAGGGRWASSNDALSKEDSDRQSLAVDRLIARMDSNGDGQIQWEEFWNFFKAQQDANYLKQFGARLSNLSTEELYTIWNNYDVDGSGELELDEILALLGDLLGIGVSGGRHAGCFETYLQPGAKLTWDAFYTIIVPLIQEGGSNLEPMVGIFPPAVITSQSHPPITQGTTTASEDVMPRIIAMFQYYAPEKLPQIESLVRKVLRPEKFLQTLIERYGPEPHTLGAGGGGAAPLQPPAPKPLVFSPYFNPAEKPRIIKMYERYAPDKLATVDGIIAAFPHEHANMLQMLVQKYGPEPYYQILSNKK